MSETDELPRQLRLLKGLVIGLGILLGVAALVVVFAVLWKMSDRSKQAAATAPNAVTSNAISATDDLPAFGTAQLALPVGCEVESATASGDRLILLVGGTDNCRRVVVADLKSGKKLGEFQFPTAGQ
jgi:hypothetical protein